MAKAKKSKKASKKKTKPKAASKKNVSKVLTRIQRREITTKLQRREGQRQITITLQCANGPQAHELGKLIANCLRANIGDSNSYVMHTK